MSNKVLVYRFSSFGDVLISIPVILSALEAYPALHITYLTRHQFIKYIPKHKRLRGIGIKLEQDYAGLLGIYRLYHKIYSLGPFDLHIDLHNVLRTKILNLFFLSRKIKTYTLHKNRKPKREYVSGRNRTVLPRTMELYQKVFEKAEFRFPIENFGNNLFPEITPAGKSEKTIQIGIAPFAKHATKRWPLQNFTNLISLLNKEWDIQFYIFGSFMEIEEANSISGPNITNLCSLQNPAEEISIIKQLDLMVSMDSANMHLADILGVPVISIWGGTHPDIGFRPSFQNDENIISALKHLDCQPCSVFGKSKCSLRSDPFLCLNSIHPNQVRDRISILLQKKH